MTTIKSSTTTTTAYSVEADTTGALVIQTGAAPTTAVTIGSDQSVTFAGAVSLSGNQTITGNLTVNGNTTLGDANTDTILMTGAPSIGGAGLGMGMGFRNRIINGAMVIDQRNAGASITPTNGQYGLDRWRNGLSVASKFSVQQNAGAVTPPQGFVNYLGATSLSAYSVGASEVFLVQQYIEGYNVADLAWGTASASSVTLSFWVRSSLTGTFGGSLQNSDRSRCFPLSYTISVANTWEQKTVTIAGDTSGTWLTTSGIGIQVNFSLGTGSTFSGTAGAWSGSTLYSATGAVSVVGTNGATFYITGVQLEKGSTATSFDYRPYGTEYNLCARYFFSSYPYGIVPGTASQTTAAIYGIGVVNQFMGGISFPTMMRTVPTVTGYMPSTGTAGQFGNYGDDITGYTISGTRATDKAFTNFLSSSTIAAGAGLRVLITASAEL